MIAIAGPDLPHEILLAAGRHAGPIGFDPDCDTHRAAQWMESKFAPWAFAVIESWARGAYDGLENVLFSRADDTSQRLYYYVCELKRRGLLAGPEPLICDVAKVPRDSSLRRTSHAVAALARDLNVTCEALEAAIAETNLRRAHVAEPPAGRRCLIVGTPPPDDRLHEVIAAQGFRAVGLTLAEEWMSLGEPVAEATGNPAMAIARNIQARQSGPRSFADPAKRLRSKIEDCNASAVILWRIEEDEAQCWHLPIERQVLQDVGLPALVLTRRDWRARDGVAQEITGFLSKINA
jgi:hypothetical protein